MDLLAGECPMRTLVLIGLAGLAATAVVEDAEARGLRLHFGGLRVRESVPAASIRAIPHGTAPAPGLAIRSDRGVGARPTYVVLPSPLTRPEPVEVRSAADAGAPALTPATEVPAAVAVKAAVEPAPWCRSQRVVGTGAGFCLIN